MLCAHTFANEDVVRDVQHECEVVVHQNQPLDNLCVEDAMDIPLAAPVVVGLDDEGEGDRNVSNYLMQTSLLESGALNRVLCSRKMMEVFDNVSPEVMIESVGSCSGGDPIEDIDVIDVFD
ncbi:unnamed protein product [Ilex paraguariensis]|uniref:Uncharacterized protein n=1 Tax=Ilex paraguariensis TaxID=185542 RepID=A0ABC8R0L1_9AQUA